MLQPLGNRILIEMDEGAPTESGIYIPLNTEKARVKDGVVESYNRGKVVAIGPGKHHPRTGIRLPMMTKPGEVVRFSELAFPAIKEDGKTYALISEMDVVGVEE